MVNKEYDLHDIVVLKKPHPCGENKWEIIRLGADVRVKCVGCQRSILIPRNEFNKKLKKVLNEEI